MLKFPEKYRKTMQGLPFIPGCNGVFVVPASKTCYACIIASNGMGWEHVSVHMVQDGRDRTPTWEEMCVVKDLFWGREDCVVQYHPPQSNYINRHPHTLHLWRPIGQIIPQPDKSMV